MVSPSSLGRAPLSCKALFLARFQNPFSAPCNLPFQTCSKASDTLFLCFSCFCPSTFQCFDSAIFEDLNSFERLTSPSEPEETSTKHSVTTEEGETGTTGTTRTADTSVLDPGSQSDKSSGLSNRSPQEKPPQLSKSSPLTKDVTGLRKIRTDTPSFHRLVLFFSPHPFSFPPLFSFCFLLLLYLTLSFTFISPPFQPDPSSTSCSGNSPHAWHCSLGSHPLLPQEWHLSPVILSLSLAP